MTLDPVSRRRALALLAAGGSLFGVRAGAVAAPAPNSAPDLASAPAPQSTALLDAIAWRLLELQPERATSLGVDTGEHAGLRSRLEDRSPDGVARLVALLESDLARVDMAAAQTPDAPTRQDLAVIRTAYRTALAGYAQPYGDVAIGGWRNTPYVVIQNVGAYIDTPRFLDAEHPVRDAADAEAYLTRLGAMAQQLDGELERLHAAAAQGLIAPDFLLDKAIAQMRSTIADARGPGAGLVQSLARRTGDIPGQWERRARGIVDAAVVPALERQLAELVAQRARATSAPGMNLRPHGPEFYAWALRASTTTALSPAEVHQRGLAELAALHDRMDPILRSLGYTSGSVGERMKAVSQDPRFMFPEGDPGRAEILAFIQKRLAWIKAQMPRAFVRLAPGNVEVRRLPIAEEPGAPTAYGGPGSIDGSIPGRMWVNLGSTALHRKYDLPTLVHHEAIPGHVWQGEYAQRLPLIRSILAFNAYSEGWALYAEQLADELGAYDDDPVGRLGYLQSLAFRACRMVADTGLHAKGWSRAQALDFFVTGNGNTRDEMDSEIDRYCSWPGQACGYKVGHSEIVRQRARAMSALGSRYDLRAFDQAVVDGGNAPLDVLDDTVGQFIAGRRKNRG